MNLPNKLTVGRLAAIPLIIACFEERNLGIARLAAFVIFVLACLTDGLDGYIARSRNLVTVLGQFLDPLADKALICTVLCYMIRWGYAAPASVIIILAREFVVAGVRMAAANDGRVIAANIFGKIKTAFQMFSLSAVLLFDAMFYSVRWLVTLSNVCVWIIAALTAVSGTIYVIQNKDIFSK